MDVHERIKSARENKGLSQSQVAEAIGIAYQNYWKIENGKTELSVNRLYQIADVLEVPVGELLGIEPKVDSGLLDKVKELEKEVGYLKKILEAKESEEAATERFIEQLIEDGLESVATQLDVGRFEFTHKLTGEVIIVPGATWINVEQSPRYNELHEGYKKGEYTERVVYTEADTHFIRLKAIQENYDYWSLLDSLGYIKDEAFQKLIDQQGRIMFE